MNNNLRNAAIGAVVCLVVAPIIGLLLGFEFAVIIMLEIAVIAFFTVLFVMIVGSVEDHYPTEAKDSAAVTAWSQREAAQQQHEVEENVETIEENATPAS